MAALPLILLAVGTAVTVAGQIQSANAAKAAGDYNKRVGEMNANTAEQQAQIKAQIASRQAYIRQGAMVAGYADNGVDTSTGSPLEIMAASAADAERDRQNIIYNGEVQATSLRNGATLAGFQGESAQTSGYMSAAGTLFSAAGKGMNMGGTGAGSTLS